MSDILKSFSTAVEQLELLKKELKSQQATSRLLSGLIDSLRSIGDSAERHAAELSESNKKIEFTSSAISAWQQQVQLPDFRELIEDFVRQVTYVQESLKQLTSSSDVYRQELGHANSVLVGQVASAQKLYVAISENGRRLSERLESIPGEWREQAERDRDQLAQLLRSVHSASDAKSDELRAALTQIFDQTADLFGKSSEMSASQIIRAVLAEQHASAEQLSRTISERDRLLSERLESILAEWREETGRGRNQLAQLLRNVHSASDAKSDELRAALTQIFKQLPDLLRRSSELSAGQMTSVLAPKIDVQATKLAAMEQRLCRIEESLTKISNLVDLMSKKKRYFFW